MKVYRTYEQDLKELNITEEEFNNIISYVYEKSNEDMIIFAKAIREGAKIPPALQRAFERVLDMRYTERIEAYKIYYGI